MSHSACVVTLHGPGGSWARGRAGMATAAVAMATSTTPTTAHLCCCIWSSRGETDVPSASGKCMVHVVLMWLQPAPEVLRDKIMPPGRRAADMGKPARACSATCTCLACLHALLPS